MLRNRDINIRQATEDDLAQLVSFTFSIHQQEDDQSIPTHPNFLVNLETWIKKELRNSLSLILIAETSIKKDKRQAIGFIGASTIINDNGFLENPTKGLVSFLWVEQEYRKQQVAQRLLKTIESCFLENSVSLVECSFTVKNNLAKEFWSKAGYDIHSVIARKFITDSLN